MTDPHPPSDPNARPRPGASDPGWYGSSGSGSSTGGWPDAAGSGEAPSYSDPSYSDPAHRGPIPAAPPVYDAYGSPAPGSPPPAYPGAYGAMPLQPGQSAGTGLSISSLVIGILSLVGGFGLLFPPIVGVVLGHMARRREPNGRGMALAGLIMNYISLAIVVLAVVALIALIVLGFSLDAVYNDGVTGLNS